MSPARSNAFTSLSEIDDQTAARKARLKESRANNSAPHDIRAQHRISIDLTGPDDLSDHQNEAPPKKARPELNSSTKGDFSQMRSVLATDRIKPPATHSSPILKTENPIILASDDEEELPADPLARSMQKSGLEQSPRRNAISNSPGITNGASLPKKRARGRDETSLNSQMPEKRRRVDARDGQNPLQRHRDLSSEASKKLSELMHKRNVLTNTNWMNTSSSRSVTPLDATRDGAISDARGLEKARSARVVPLSASENLAVKAANTLNDTEGSMINHEGAARGKSFEKPEKSENQSGASAGEGGRQSVPKLSDFQRKPVQESYSKESAKSQDTPDAENVSAGASPSAQLQEDESRALARGSGNPTRKPSNSTVNGHGNRTRDGASLEPSHMPTSASAAPDLSGLPLPQQVELIIGKYMQEMRDDTNYFTKARLKRARQSITQHRQRNAKNQHDQQQNGQPAAKSVAAKVFARQCAKTAADNTTKAGDGSAKFFFDNYRGNKTSRSTLTAKPTLCEVEPDYGDVPGYAHYVSVNSNILAPNTKTMTVWPYFGEDQPNPNEFEHLYDKDTTERQRKIRRLLQAQKAEQYVDSALQAMDLSWNDVLRFLLNPRPDVGTSVAARDALRNKEASCSEDFPHVEGSKRWKSVLQSLDDISEADTEKLARAAIFCDTFRRMTGFPLWHVARRSDAVKSALDAQEPSSNPIDSRTCRICLTFNCTQHGELREKMQESSEDESQEDDHSDDSSAETETDEAVTTDIMHPVRMNYRKRVPFPKSPPGDEHDTEITATMTKQRKMTIYWEKGNYTKAGDCGPFYPCYHPGVTCAAANCSCVVNRTPCEKSCSCSSACPRKFQGCACSSARNRKSGDFVCMRDERCACYQMGRECDPDLCGSCGVCDVLDPVHRHDNMKSKCHNAAIQRAIPEHTLLGDSGVHGMGLYAGQDIKEHEFIGEYKGEVVTQREAERRGAVYYYQNNSYLFMLNPKQEVDSTLYGNKTRFMNHRSKPGANVYPLVRLVNTVHRIGLFAAYNIKAGEELFFDYGRMYSQDLIGGKETLDSKPARTKLVETFYEVEDEEDEVGNLRAKKAPANGRSRPRARKTDPARPKKQKGGARVGAGRKPGKKKAQAVRKAAAAAAALAENEAAHDRGQTALDDVSDIEEGDDDTGVPFELAQDRLAAYNISQDKDLSVIEGDDGDDDDEYDPSGPDDGVDDKDSSEEEFESEDEEEYYMRTRRGRPRKAVL